MSNPRSLQQSEAGSIRRPIKAPYFLFRTRDRLGTYFDRSHYRIIQFHNEPISEFLPPAKLAPSGDEVVYDISKIARETIDKMEYLPDTAIEAFEEAARAFYGLDGFDSRVNESERVLRLHFRLPDPAVEPEAYWLYGPRDDRKLLILWGTEYREGTSLPLCPVPGLYPDGDTVLDRLRNVRMSWRDKQKETIALMRARQLPLAQFICQPVRDQNGKLESLRLGDETIPLKGVRRLKRLWQKEFNRLQHAVDNFYGPCSGKDNSISDYECELRKSFKLPDPQVQTDVYFQHKGRLLILVEDSLKEESALYPDKRPELNLPPCEKDKYGNTKLEYTLMDRLRQCLHPSRTYGLVGVGAGITLVIVFLLSWIFWVDGSPPELVKVYSENDLEKVWVQFDEPVRIPSFENSSEDLQSERPAPFLIVDPENGRHVEIRNFRRAPDDASGSIYQLTVEPLVEGKEYRFIANSVTDQSVKANQIQPGAEMVFQPLDTMPPERPLLSAHNNDSTKLVLIFNEPLDARLSTRRGNFLFPNNDFRVSAVDLLEDGKTIEISASRIGSAVDESGFVDGGVYSLVVDGIADASYSKNLIAEPFEYLNFRYLDKVAPRLESVDTLNQFDLQVEFDEGVTKESALSTSLYSLKTDTDVSPQILGVQPLLDDRRFKVQTTGLFNGVEYVLEVRDVTDRSKTGNTASLLLSDPFYFTGKEDTDPPGIAGKPKISSDLRSITIKFDEPVDPISAMEPGNFAIINIPEIVVVNVDKLDAGNTLFSLSLSGQLEKHREYSLLVDGVVDRIGNTVENLETEKFRRARVLLGMDLAIEEISPVSLTEIRVLMNTDLLNHENRASDPSYYRILLQEPDSSPLLIDSVGINPANASEILLVLDASTPLEPGASYRIAIESGLRIQSSSKDQTSSSGTFDVP